MIDQANLPRITRCEDCRASVRLSWEEIPKHLHHCSDSYYCGFGFCDCGWRTFSLVGPDPFVIGMLAGAYLGFLEPSEGREAALLV